MLSKSTRLWLGLIIATSLLSLASACGNKGGDEAEDTGATETDESEKEAES